MRPGLASVCKFEALQDVTAQAVYEWPHCPVIAHSSHVGTVALLHTIQKYKPLLLVGKPAPTVESSTKTSTEYVDLPQPEPTNTQPRLLLSFQCHLFVYILFING